MKNLRMKYPIWVSLFLMILFFLTINIGSLPILIWPDMDTYLVQLLSELFSIAVMLLMVWWLKMGFTLRPAGGSVREKLLLCLPVGLVYLFALAGNLVENLSGRLASPPKILIFILCMLAAGFAEELLFRGMITRMIFVKYRRTSLGVWFSMLVSGVLFGLFHLPNALVVDFSSALIQAAAAICMGIFLSAVYLRSGSLWTVALLHAFMDFSALLASGVFGAETLTDALGQYSLANLAASLYYFVLGAFLLRPSKLREMTIPEETPPQSHVVYLLIALALFAALYSCAAVVSL